MLKLQKSSLILISIIVVLTAGCVSIYTLGYTPGTVWHKAEDVKSGTFGQNVGKGNYNFPDNIDVSKQVTAGTMFKVGSSELSSSQLKVNGSSLVVTSTGNVGIGTTSPQANLEVKGGMYVEGASGDVNGDGTVGLQDVLFIVRWLNGLETFTKEQYIRADINGDGKVTILDADLIQRYLVQIITLEEARNLVGKQAADKAIQTTYDGKVGIGTTSPQAKLEVSGNIIAARPTTADQVATKGYVDELIAEVRAIVTGAQPLVNGAHTQQDCINAGGEVVDSDTAYKQCRFNASACPSGWTQYKNWSTTINPSSCGGCYCQGGGCCITGTYWASILRSGSCPSSHSWSNNPVEYAVYGTYGTPVQGIGKVSSPDCCTCTITSPITQIGCY